MVATKAVLTMNVVESLASPVIVEVIVPPGTIASINIAQIMRTIMNSKIPSTGKAAAGAIVVVTKAALTMNIVESLNPSVHGSHSVTSNDRIHQRRINQEEHEDLRDRIHKKSRGSRDHSSHKSRAGDEYHGERRVPSVYGGHSVTGDDRIHQRRTNQEDHDDFRDRLDKKSRSRLEIPNEPRSRCSSKASVKRGDFDQNHSDPRSPGGCEPYNDEKPPDDNEGLGDPDNPDADEARDDKDNPGSGDDSDSDDGSGSGDDSGSDDGQAKEREGNDGQGEEDKGNNGQGEEVEATNAPEEEDEENDVNERL